jgi:hypothetical protein
MLAALVYAPMVLDLSPAADVSWFAGTAARVLLAADLAGGVDPRADPAAPDQGLRNAGRAWLDLVHGMAATSSEARAVNDALWPLQQLVSGGAVSGDALRAWVATLPKEPAVDALQRQELLLGLLTSLGDDVTIADWQPLLAQGAPPAEAAAPVASPLLWQAVTLAAKARHIGDCVALSLQLVGGDTGQQPPRLAVLKAIESLTTAGRVVDARPLAIETALVQGL